MLKQRKKQLKRLKKEEAYMAVTNPKTVMASQTARRSPELRKILLTACKLSQLSSCGSHLDSNHPEAVTHVPDANCR